jgi:hypothetical protein
MRTQPIGQDVRTNIGCSVMVKFEASKSSKVGLPRTPEFVMKQLVFALPEHELNVPLSQPANSKPGAGSAVNSTSKGACEMSCMQTLLELHVPTPFEVTRPPSNTTTASLQPVIVSTTITSMNILNMAKSPVFPYQGIKVCQSS